MIYWEKLDVHSSTEITLYSLLAGGLQAFFFFSRVGVNRRFCNTGRGVYAL